MKNFLVLFLVFFSVSLFAEKKMYVTPKAQIAYGFGEYHSTDGSDITINPGFGIGGIFGYTVMPKLSVEANLSFDYWLVNELPDGIEQTIMNLPIMFGANYQFHEMAGGIAGLGMRVALPSMEMGGVDMKLDPRFEFGFYAGAEINVKNFIIRPTFNYFIGGEQTADGNGGTDVEDDMYIMIELGYKIGIEPVRKRWQSITKSS